MGLWSELENQVRLPRCTCGKYECDLGEKFIKMVEEEKAHQFLMGLNDEMYSNIRGQILAIEPLPSLDKIFNMVHQEENHKNLMMDRDERVEGVAMFAVFEKITNSDKPTCKQCGKFGHDEANCFEVIDYPPGWSS